MSDVAQTKWPLEDWLLNRICEPIRAHIPEAITPNMLSWLGHLITWTTLILASATLYTPHVLGVVLIAMASVSMFAQMLLDNLDGMHARATGQTSKFGEFLDHWLDAAHVPMNAAAIAFILAVFRIEPWLLIAVQVTVALIYHNQLLHYHYKGEFVPPPTSGTVAQFLMTLIFIGVAIYFYFMPRELPFNVPLIVLGTVAACIAHVRQLVFYWKRLGRIAIHSLPFVLMLVAVSGLYLLNAMNWFEYALATVLVSFRITGSYVLNSVLGKHYDGLDFGIPVVVLGLYLSHALWSEVMVYGITLQTFLTYLAFGYLVLRNLIDTYRALPEFKAADQESEVPA